MAAPVERRRGQSRRDCGAQPRVSTLGGGGPGAPGGPRERSPGGSRRGQREQERRASRSGVQPVAAPPAAGSTAANRKRNGQTGPEASLVERAAAPRRESRPVAVREGSWATSGAVQISSWRLRRSVHDGKKVPAAADRPL